MQNGLFNVTEEQQSLVELIRDFMTKEIKPHVLEWEKEGHYPQEIIEQGIEMGLHMLQVPEEYGGMGLDTTTTAMMIEEGAKVESTFMGMFNVTSMGGKIVMAAGNEEQKQYYSGLLQKGRMERSTDIKRKDSLCSGFLQCICCLFHIFLPSCNHNLSRTIVVGDHYTTSICQHFLNLSGIQSKNRCHGSLTTRYCILHQNTAFSYCCDCIFCAHSSC